MGSWAGESLTVDSFEIEVGRLSVEPEGDAVVAYQGVITIESSGLNLDFYADLESVRVGRAIAAFVFEDSGSPLADSLPLVEVVVERL